MCVCVCVCVCVFTGREAKNKGRVARYYELVKLASSGRKAGPALALDQA